MTWGRNSLGTQRAWTGTPPTGVTQRVAATLSQPCLGPAPFLVPPILSPPPPGFSPLLILLSVKVRGRERRREGREGGEGDL